MAALGELPDAGAGRCVTSLGYWTSGITAKSWPRTIALKTDFASWPTVSTSCGPITAIPSVSTWISPRLPMSWLVWLRRCDERAPSGSLLAETYTGALSAKKS